MTNRQHLHKILSTYRTELLLFLRRRGVVAADAHDLAQEAFLRMLRIKDPERIADPKNYLFTVANHLLRESRYTKGPRRNLVRLSLEKALVAEPMQLAVELDEDFRIGSAAQSQRIARAFDALSASDRLLLLMRFRDDLTLQQIGEINGVNKQAVCSMLQRAIVRLRKQWDARGTEK